MSRGMAVVLMLASTLSASLRAQDPSDTWRVFAAQLPAGSFVVVHLDDGSSVEGTFIRSTATTLKVLPKRRMAVPLREIGYDRVVSIEPRKEGMSPGAKVLIGVGTAAGVVLTAALIVFSGMW